MNNYQIEDSKTYMKKSYPSSYKRTQRAITRFNNELTIKLEKYYLKMIKDVYNYNRDDNDIHIFTSKFCTYLNELNNTELEYYIEYCLEFYEQNFYDILYNIYMINLKTNLILKQICACYIRYSKIEQIQELLNNIFNELYIDDFKDSEIQTILNNVIEIEIKHVLNCYEKSKNNEIYCDSCVPYCQVEKTKTKNNYKRTTPFRVY